MNQKFIPGLIVFLIVAAVIIVGQTRSATTMCVELQRLKLVLKKSRLTLAKEKPSG